jgi:hypothetical protein
VAEVTAAADEILQNRVTIVVPENRAKFEPLNLSLAQHVLYSPCALKVLEGVVAEYPATVVHTAAVGRPTLELLAHLPPTWMVGPTIATSSQLGSPSQCRDLLESFGVPMLLHSRGATNVIDTLADLIATHTEIECWAMHANESRDPLSIAYFYTKHLECLADIRSKRTCVPGRILVDVALAGLNVGVAYFPLARSPNFSCQYWTGLETHVWTWVPILVYQVHWRQEVAKV